MHPEEIILKLQEHARQYAEEALRNPSEKTVFEYGQHHGVMLGVGLASQWLREMLQEEDGDDDE